MAKKRELLVVEQAAEIVLASKESMNEATDCVYVFLVCREDFDKVRIVRPRAI